MHDVYEVLRTKEILIQQLSREIEALRLVAPLLSNNPDSEPLADTPGSRTESDAQSVRARGLAASARLPKESDRGRTTVTEDETLGAAQSISGRLRRLAKPVLNAVNSMAASQTDGYSAYD